ncbi:uncharacterized protein LOC128919707 [Zeugodacus cucurbitae]|uniref:uncharacterized protein LOC128919707 n=1 Tax=Zeugodacus cucurbitae TaxID=28588 RepID=UPI0023D90003|nr:uncharacterized protein LOC128919707 [Zeugodacus cucurbitae]XP_054083303.1 uncharacterized protein LOC128919707 [Zeugodacus cucurbitae]XP_054083304.1 uncharacterized protein LOC128919707 [Zeugodacus cucurbitae]XP_054083305.1 uncharacterized protein LOC128919707 [Zeugodacus cucurbitae]
MVTVQLAIRRNNNKQQHKINKKQSGTMCSSSSSSNGGSASAQVKCRRGGVGVASAPSLSLGLWLLPVLLVLLAWQQQPCEGRYLPTRSHGDDLDKLRELMLQILESSNEEQRPPNEANGNTLAQRASWLNKLNAMDGVETQRKYGARGMYDNGRYY